MFFIKGCKQKRHHTALIVIVDTTVFLIKLTFKPKVINVAETYV